HLVYARGDALEAVAFDAATGSLRGEPVELGVRVAMSRGSVADFDLSRNGTLVYVPPVSTTGAALVWVDRKGHETPTGAPDGGWVYPRISPDGRFVASDIWEMNRDIYTWDLERKTMLRLTTHPREDLLPVWNADGRRVWFASDRGGVFNLYTVPADGSHDAELETPSTGFLVPASITPDNRFLLGSQETNNNADIVKIDLNNPKVVVPLIATDATERLPIVSRDGCWLAYQSNATGQDTMY